MDFHVTQINHQGHIDKIILVPENSCLFENEHVETEVNLQMQYTAPLMFRFLTEKLNG